MSAEHEILDDAGATGPRDPEELEAGPAPRHSGLLSGLRLGAIHLTVADLGRSISFYEDQIGLVGDVTSFDPAAATSAPTVPSSSAVGVSPVPEPGTLALLAVGVVCGVVASRRRARNR